MTWDQRQALDVVERIHVEGEEVTPDDIGLDTDNPHEAITAWRKAQIQAAAARQVEKAAGQRVAQLLGVGGAARIGDQIVRYHTGWKERCINPKGFAAYLTGQVKSDLVDLADVFNPSYAKKG